MAQPTLLVIDDDKHFLELLQEYLEAQGYLVYTAFDGSYAVPLALRHKPSLIILDIDMPITNGFQALAKLHAAHETQSIPVIMLTGVVSGQVYPVVESIPNVSHLKKPVQLEDLLSLVHHYIPNNL